MARWVVIALALVGCSDVLGLPDPRPLELGVDCTGSAGGDGSKCPATTSVCMTVTGSADFCSISCGTGPAGSGSSSPIPPDGGDQLCAQLATTGTPACAYPVETGPSVDTWFCLIACGTFEGHELGSCPVGLTCTGNFCQ